MGTPGGDLGMTWGQALLGGLTRGCSKMKPNSNGGVAGAAIKTALLWLFSYGDSRLYWYFVQSNLALAILTPTKSHLVVQIIVKKNKIPIFFPPTVFALNFC